jgi:hypothetical protein
MGPTSGQGARAYEGLTPLLVVSCVDGSKAWEIEDDRCGALSALAWL